MHNTRVLTCAGKHIVGSTSTVIFKVDKDAAENSNIPFNLAFFIYLIQKEKEYTCKVLEIKSNFVHYNIRINMEARRSIRTLP